MEDYHVAKFVQMEGHELGLFAIYDGHLGDRVPLYLQKHLFPNILTEVFYLFTHNVHIFFSTNVKVKNQFQWKFLLCYLALSGSIIIGRVLGQSWGIYFKSV